ARRGSSTTQSLSSRLLLPGPVAAGAAVESRERSFVVRLDPREECELRAPGRLDRFLDVTGKLLHQRQIVGGERLENLRALRCGLHLSLPLLAEPGAGIGEQ